MDKIAYYADYIWYNSKPVTKSWLLTEGNLIKGCAKEPPLEYKKEQFTNSSIFPSFVNTHCHAAMVYFRGLADDLPLMDWLNNHIWPLENTLVTEEFVQDATELAAAELLKSGVTCINDMYFYARKSGEIFKKAGMKAVIGRGMMNEPGCINKNYLDEVKSMAEEHQNSSQIKISLCPHALYTVKIKDFEKMVNFSQQHNILIHTHLSESLWEYNEIYNKHKLSPVELMDKTGAFDCKSIFAHCVHVKEKDLSILGEKKVNISHCIKSNLKLSSGFSPVLDLIKAGANISIGTDGAASNNSLDMMSELQFVSIVHKGLSGDPTSVNAETTVQLATENGAKALGFKTGVLKEGYDADFIVISHDSENLQPNLNPLSLLVYSANKSDITNVFVAGKELMKNRKLLTIDEEKISYNSKKWTKKILNN